VEAPGGEPVLGQVQERGAAPDAELATVSRWNPMAPTPHTSAAPGGTVGGPIVDHLWLVTTGADDPLRHVALASGGHTHAP
jgi:hypothetical protein